MLTHKRNRQRYIQNGQCFSNIFNKKVLILFKQNKKIIIGARQMLRKKIPTIIILNTLVFVFVFNSILNCAIMPNAPAGKKVPITGETNQMKKFLNFL